MYTPEQVKVLKKRMFECNAHKDANISSAKHYDFYEKITGIPQIVVSAVLSSLSFSVASENNYNQGIGITSAILSGCITVLTGINRFYDYQKCKAKHMKYSTMFGALERKINVELSKTNQLEYDVFCESINEEYNNLRNECPMYPHGIHYSEILTNVIQENITLEEIIVKVS